MSKRTRRALTDTFKREAVQLTKVGDRKIGEVARDLDLTDTALRQWVKRAEEETVAAAPGALTTIERDELIKLRKRVKREPLIFDNRNGPAVPDFRSGAQHPQRAKIADVCVELDD